MSRIFLFLLLTTNIVAQEFIDSDTFEAKTAKGITVVEFWAEWNSVNEVPFLEQLKSCDTYKVCITKSSSVSNEFNIVSIPTIVILNNGVEHSRFNPSIMMQTTATKKDIQGVVDDIIMSRFE